LPSLFQQGYHLDLKTTAFFSFSVLLVDVTGNWHLPFAGSIGLLLLGAVLAF
jgi:hypothetical protein